MYIVIDEGEIDHDQLSVSVKVHLQTLCWSRHIGLVEGVATSPDDYGVQVEVLERELTEATTDVKKRLAKASWDDNHLHEEAQGLHVDSETLRGENNELTERLRAATECAD